MGDTSRLLFPTQQAPRVSLSNRLPRATDLVLAGQQQGLHDGAQVALALGNETPLLGHWGEAREGVPLDDLTLMHWLSSGKPVAAVAIMQLVERGRLGLDDPVALHWPEFGQNGKQSVTVFHLLTHTGGFRKVGVEWPQVSRQEFLDRIVNMPLEPDWTAGEKAGYHPSTSWHVLGELVARRDGRPFWQYIREDIFLPLEMPDCWIGMPADDYAAIAERMSELRHTNTSDRRRHRFSCPEGVQLCSPGETLVGPAGQVLRLGQMLLAGGQLGGVRLLQQDTVAAMTRRQRETVYDHSFLHVIDWGLGLIIDSKRYGIEAVPYGYGRHASEQTFGHSGNQSSVLLIDPPHQLVLALAFNGMPGERPHQRRIKPLLEAIYEDLGLGSDRS